MEKSLSETGLSLSQAQSISNLCHQETKEIDNKLNVVNNYSKTIKIGDKDLIQVKGNKIPNNVEELLNRKSILHSVQAFLMENIKAKERLLEETKNSIFVTDKIEPPHPALKTNTNLPKVNEQYGWDSLPNAEYNEFLDVEAKASHYGQFIHKGGKLDLLRRELPSIPDLEWFEVRKDEKTPVSILTHHTSEDLLKIHNDLAIKHREFESRVNYFKAKVKNLTNDRNAEISKINANEMSRVATENQKLMDVYTIERNKFYELLKIEKEKFEGEKEIKTKAISQLRINVDERFKPIIDELMSKEN